MVVVGASGGLGAPIVDELRARGAIVLGAGRSGPDIAVDLRDSRAGEALVRGALGMQGRLDGTSLRVPVPDGSVTDFVGILAKEASVDEVNAAFEAAASSGPRAASSAAAPSGVIHARSWGKDGIPE